MKGMYFKTEGDMIHEIVSEPVSVDDYLVVVSRNVETYESLISKVMFMGKLYSNLSSVPGNKNHGMFTPNEQR